MSTLHKIETVRSLVVLADASRQAMIDPRSGAVARDVATDCYVKLVDQLMDHLTVMLDDGSMKTLLRLAALEGGA